MLRYVEPGGFARVIVKQVIEVKAALSMADELKFVFDEDWEANLHRLREHLEAIDPACAKMLFDNMEMFVSEDGNARRNFNAAILAALDAAADAEVVPDEGGST